MVVWKAVVGVRRFVACCALVVLVLSGASCSFGDDGPTTADRPEDPTPEVLSNTVTAETENGGVATPTAVITVVEGSDPGNVYVVQPGDLLGVIAANLGVSLEALQAANDITDPNLIQVGDELIIPEAEETEGEG